MKIASYKATRSGAPGLFNILVRWWRASKYSHNELVFADGMCASSSWMDGGIRFKQIELNPQKWDIVELDSKFSEEKARQWFTNNLGSKYNLLLILSFVLPFLARQASKRGYVCSTAIAESLGFKESWRIDPALLHEWVVNN